LTLAFFAIFFLSLLFSFVLTRYVRDFASRRGWVEIPSQERHLHLSPLPRLGGVAIFLSFSLTMLAAALLACYIPHHSGARVDRFPVGPLR
jgi:UDP-GlcNAc:undecaprenyl-phosphate GlcNAc-1-phosphate transferase